MCTLCWPKHSFSQNTWFVATLVLMAFLLPLTRAKSCWADDESLQPFVSVEEQYTDGTRVSGDRGKVGVSTQRVTAGMLPVTIEYDASSFFWKDIDRLPFGDHHTRPWSTLQVLSATLDYAGDVGNGFGVFGEAVAFSGYEDELSGSLGLNLTGGLSYALSSMAKLNVGATGLIHRVRSRPLPCKAPVN